MLHSPMRLSTTTAQVQWFKSETSPSETFFCLVSMGPWLTAGSFKNNMDIQGWFSRFPSPSLSPSLGLWGERAYADISRTMIRSTVLGKVFSRDTA